MPTSSFSLRLVFAALICGSAAGVAAAAPLHEALLPETTQGFVLVEDVEQFRESWERTQFGQLLEDPVMQPFVEDLRDQLKNRLSRLDNRLGLTIEDLEGVPGGALTMAAIQPAEGEAAMAVLVDITGHEPQAQALLEKIETRMAEQKATRQTRTASDAELAVYTLPPGEGEQQNRTRVVFILDKTLVATDNLAVAEEIAGRFIGEHDDNLASRAAFQAVMRRAAQSQPDLAPEVRWFVNPFGYAEVMRAADLGQEQRGGKDMLKILASQGFTAIQGVGGFANLDVEGKYELLHRTVIYAPPVPGAPEGQRYELAARMLQFPNGGAHNPQPWVPRDLATYVSFNWKVAEAFEYSETLVDAIVGEEGVFEDVIDSIEQDPNGPQIDLRSDLVAYLGTRATVVTDYTLPITPKSERLVVAIEAVEPGPLADTIEKTMKTDPDARRVEFGEHIIWEIVEQPQDLPQLPDLQFDGFDPIGGADGDHQEKRKLPNSAVAVANGQLYVASHSDFLKKVLAEHAPRETLAQAFDYQMVMTELARLHSAPISMRAFSRTEEEYRPTYELIRSNQMPQSKTLLGQLLNLLLGEGEEGELRRQRIQGDKLPEFEAVRRYFGPAGIVVSSEENGWFALGILLNKDAM